MVGVKPISVGGDMRASFGLPRRTGSTFCTDLLNGAAGIGARRRNGQDCKCGAAPAHAPAIAEYFRKSLGHFGL
jgi:hypothetical protein